MDAEHLIPKKLFFTSGTGRHDDHLVSFGMALRDAGIEDLNLVPVSSIVPPGCLIISKEEGLSELNSGEIVFVVLSRNASSDPGRLISASIGCALPQDSSLFGYLAECHTFDKHKDETCRIACDRAVAMHRTLSGGDIKITCIAEDTVADRGWTTVVCAAVFLLS